MKSVCCVTCVTQRDYRHVSCDMRGQEYSFFSSRPLDDDSSELSGKCYYNIFDK